MSQNDSVEEIIIDQPVSIQTTVTDGVVSNINVDPPKTNEEKVVEWINRNEYVDETESVENEEVVSTIFDHEQDELATLERTTENLIADEVSGKDTTINTSLNTLHVQHSILHHAYHTQLNPPKQSYMRALPSQKVWSRDLRRIASASTQPESTQTTEYSQSTSIDTFVISVPLLDPKHRIRNV